MFALRDLDVLDALSWFALATASAAISTQPCVGSVSTCPVKRNENLAFESLGHRSYVERGRVVHNLCFTILRECGLDTRCDSVAFGNFYFHMNWLIGIDCELAARSIAIVAKVPNAILPATVCIAVKVSAVFVLLITRMDRVLKSVLVGLHKVHHWALVLVKGTKCITVEVILAFIEVSIPVFAWHRGGVEHAVATTLEARHVYVPLDRSTKEVGLEKVGTVGIEYLIVDHVAHALYVTN